MMKFEISYFNTANILEHVFLVQGGPQRQFCLLASGSAVLGPRYGRLGNRLAGVIAGYDRERVHERDAREPQAVVGT